MPFNSLRFGIARKRRLLNKKGVAAALGVSPYTVLRYESGKTIPSNESVELIAKTLAFPFQFFFGDDLDEPLDALVSFRSQTAMSAAVRDAALAAGSIGFLISDYVEERFDLPAVNVPDLNFYDPDTASRALRSMWHLGEKPISNMVHLLESKGVRIFSLAENTKTVNAYSLWRRGKPYMFLNTMKTAENSRFDAAHELGHLVLHQDGKVKGREAEEQANQFASAFLMPQADILAEIPKVYTIERVVEKKARWKVSVAALNYRLRKLRITSEWQNRNFCIEISKRGWNVAEPDGIERERSVVWEKVLKALWGERTTSADIARELKIPEPEFLSLVFGVVGRDDTKPSAGRRELLLIRSYK